MRVGELNKAKKADVKKNKEVVTIRKTEALMKKIEGFRSDANFLMSSSSKIIRTAPSSPNITPGMKSRDIF
jgi:hypothetical protein